MIKEPMQEPRQLNEAAWFDPVDGTLSIGLTDSVTLTLRLEEFLDFYNSIDEIRSIILDQDDIAIGIITDKNGEQKEQLILKPDEGDYN
jgi:hypothetical protein